MSSKMKKKNLSKPYPYLETLSKREKKETVSPTVQASLSTSPAFPVLKRYMREAQDTCISIRMHAPDIKPLLVQSSLPGLEPLFSLTKLGKQCSFACL